MRDFDLIIFDCDGVLVDSEPLSCACLASALTRHGIDTSLDLVFERFLGRSFATVEAHVLATTGANLPPEFRDALRDDVTAAFTRDLRAIDGIAELLARLDQPYCLASSSDRPRIDLSLKLTGLDPAFAGRIFNAEMVARGKPAPDLFLHAAAGMGADPARCLVVEDSVSGVQAGKAAGMTVWGFTGGGHYAGRDGRGLLAAAGADRVLARLDQFDAR